MAGVRAEKSCFRLSRHSAVRLTAEAVGELARGLWAGVRQHVNCSSDPLANRPLSVSCRMIRATCEIDPVEGLEVPKSSWPGHVTVFSQFFSWL